MLATLVVALSLEVPFLPQTEALCGGAAVSMVFRYWGDRHAGAEQFAELVDRRAGGIADDILIDAVTERGWPALRLAGSLDTLQEQLEARRPPIILVADGRTRYHYVVVTGMDDGNVVVHDPAWGPSRRIPKAELLRTWKPSNYWMLVILPSPSLGTAIAAAPSVESASPLSACDALVTTAVAGADPGSLSATAARLEDARRQCLGSAAPLRELAGIRFAERRWAEATALAGHAVARDETDVYAWDVLGSSLFVQNDVPGALRAWNRIDKPRIDLVRIDGLKHARYQTIADVLGLTSNAVLTEKRFRLAERRLQSLPDRGSSRITVRPAADGYAAVDVVLAERSGGPRSKFEWAAAATRAAVDREVGVALPGFTGQGEIWQASWSWWKNRPRAAFSFSAPRTGFLPGVWRVDAGWDEQTYRLSDERARPSSLKQSRSHGGIAFGDWIAPDVRYSITARFDAWSDIATSRSVSFGGGIERRWLSDRLTAALDMAAGLPFGHADGVRPFQTMAVRSSFRSSSQSDDWLFISGARMDRVSDAAPLALWPGAGDGHGRPTLLRAHSLLDDGILDATNRSSFGRTLISASAEMQRWIPSSMPVRVGAAAFVDSARAARRLGPAADASAQIDVGVGLRVRIPGADGALRIDVAHGVRDGANALTVGWQSPR